MSRFISRSASAVLVSLILWGVSGTAVDAISVSAKPSKPSITVISAKVRSGKLGVTVEFNLASTNPASPVLSTQVKVGTLLCTVAGRAKSCKIQDLASKTYKVSARAKNKNGWGSWSTSVSFLVTNGRTWRRDSTVPATTVPATKGLKFNLKNAVGLTLKSSVSGASIQKSEIGSNLQAVDSAGNLTDAVTSGSASISRFLIAPNDKLYVVFSSKTTIGGLSCLLAEVTKSTGDPTCIESDLSGISWSDSTSYVFDPIQFDDSGAIYYSGYDGSGKSVLRRYRDGASTSLVSDNVSSLRFLTLADGRVLIGGTTTSSSSNWTRVVTLTGGLQSLVTGSFPQFMSKFPDGNVYLGFWNSPDFGVKRFLLTSGMMDSTYWISGNTNGITRDAFFNIEANYSTPNRIPELEGYYGSHVRQMVTTLDSKVYAITGTIPTLVQYYPQVAKPSTTVTAVYAMQRVLSYIILSGTNAGGQNVTTLYNTVTDSEQTLIPASNEIEVYRLNYVASSNTIMFDGLRFSDNKYVLGQIDLSTGQVTASQTGSSKLVDFQTFAS